MTKKMRLWPNMKARMTVGRATTAAPAISVAHRSDPTVRMMWDRGSGDFMKSVKGMAPRAAMATAM